MLLLPRGEVILKLKTSTWKQPTFNYIYVGHDNDKGLDNGSPWDHKIHSWTHKVHECQYHALMVCVCMGCSHVGMYWHVCMYHVCIYVFRGKKEAPRDFKRIKRIFEF